MGTVLIAGGLRAWGSKMALETVPNAVLVEVLRGVHSDGRMGTGADRGTRIKTQEVQGLMNRMDAVLNGEYPPEIFLQGLKLEKARMPVRALCACDLYTHISSGD